MNAIGKYHILLTFIKFDKKRRNPRQKRGKQGAEVIRHRENTGAPGRKTARSRSIFRVAGAFFRADPRPGASLAPQNVVRPAFGRPFHAGSPGKRQNPRRFLSGSARPGRKYGARKRIQRQYGVPFRYGTAQKNRADLCRKRRGFSHGRPDRCGTGVDFPGSSWYNNHLI